MKKYTIAVIGLGLASFCWAQGEMELQPHMKTLAATVGKTRKDVEGKMNADVAKDAETLQATFKQVAAFWSKRGTDDAVKFAQTGEAAAKDLAAAATAGDAEKIDASVKAVGAVCGACHAAHREKAADGSFKIK